MEITPQLIKSITEQHKSGDLADFIAERISAYQKIRSDLSRLEKLKEEAKAVFNKKLAEIDKDINVVVKRCDHPVIKRFSEYDDSFDECQICGAEVGGHGSLGYTG